MRTGRLGCRHAPLAAGLAVWKETTANWPSIGWPTPLRSNCCRLFPARHPVTALELSEAMPLCSCKLDACPAALELSAAMPLSFYVFPSDLENGLPDPQIWGYSLLTVLSFQSSSTCDMLADPPDSTILVVRWFSSFSTATGIPTAPAPVGVNKRYRGRWWTRVTYLPSNLQASSSTGGHCGQSGRKQAHAMEP